MNYYYLITNLKTISFSSNISTLFHAVQKYLTRQFGSNLDDIISCSISINNNTTNCQNAIENKKLSRKGQNIAIC